jgi:diacylglycerol kinase (ATP)
MESNLFNCLHPHSLMSSPILIFGNPKSGGGDAEKLFQAVTGMEGVHLITLPEEKDSWKTISPEITQNPLLKVIVAGGDGSVNWVIPLLGEFDPNFRPPLAIYPCGTGNDLSRSLKWGGKAALVTKQHFRDFISEIRNLTNILHLDIWQISIFASPSPQEVIHKRMLNYFSIGTDAKIAIDFEEY